jgi:3-methyladenine DNA glycosylase AlkD
LTSEVTTRARALVAERLPEARGLGQALADLVDDPEAFVSVLRDGLARLADDEYAAEQERVAPGSGAVIGVRWPLVHAIEKQLRRPLAEYSATSALWLAQRLATEAERELRLFAYVALERSLADDPERSWQLMRRLARGASDWISVDSLAGLYAHGLLLEPYRWAELEQLVYSDARWERRLVGSTVATIPFRLPRSRRQELRGSPGLMLIKSLIGDAEPDVQRALSWALRSWYEVDAGGVVGLLRTEAEQARADDDGHRAWVVRDALTLPAHDPRLVAELRAVLDGVRRRSGAPSTSTAAAISAGFRAPAGAEGAGLAELADQALSEQGRRQQLAGSRR